MSCRIPGCEEQDSYIDFAVVANNRLTDTERSVEGELCASHATLLFSIFLPKKHPSVSKLAAQELTQAIEDGADAAVIRIDRNKWGL